MPMAFDNEKVSIVSSMRCLTFLPRTGVWFYGLWKPQSRSHQLPPSISPSHRALRGSVDDKYTSRAPKAPSALYLIVAPLLAVCS